MILQPEPAREELYEAVDRLISMLEDSPQTAAALAAHYSGLMWAIDRIKEARYAVRLHEEGVQVEATTGGGDRE